MKERINYNIREIRKEDQDFLFDMLYQAIYVEPGAEPVGREIIDLPEIKIYASDWGRETDYGSIAIDKVTGKKIGAAWLRLIKGFGNISDDIPEIAIAIDLGYRGKGIGSALIKHLLEATSGIHKTISLSVQEGNKSAIGLYEKFGFVKYNKKGTEIIMRYDR
ncbi:MAG: GNAT family N-acetyltransferase [Actinobacteria bacterium]|nr:GNAT family N-acetyltransferase [Actinomycetota bacterium]